MAEAIISRRGNKDSKSAGKLVVETIIENTSWNIPSNVVNNKFSVRLFGGGGGGGVRNSFGYNWGGGGGGGGYMNNGEVEINHSGSVIITIGEGGNTGNPGGTTSFGTYLSANGGSAGNGGHRGYGGDGGSGGGGGLYVSENHPRGITIELQHGGRGYQFGGGSPGGNGGTWGGGAGAATYVWKEWSNYGSINNYFSGTVSKGNTSGYGGNGGNISHNGENGTNTIGDNSIDARLQGAGLGSTNTVTNILYEKSFGIGGSGGGYGGNAGQAYTSIYTTIQLAGTVWSGSTGDVRDVGWIYFYMPGGGGGYGGDGGYSNHLGAGGGGYGGKGGNGSNVAGGGGGYGNGGEQKANPGYGGGGCTNNKGGSGICIIEYYSLDS